MPPLVALLVAAAPAHAHRIAVLDLKAEAVPAETASFLSKLLASEVAERLGEVPLVPADLAALLGLEKQKQLLGCKEDAACLAEISGALGVDRIVYGSVTGQGGRVLVTIAYLDAQRAQPIARASELAPNADGAVDALLRACGRVFGPKPGAVTEPVAAAAPQPAEAVTKSAPSGLGRRGWSAVTGLGALALAGGGVAFGLTAQHAVDRGDGNAARSSAHLADGLYAGGAVLAGVTAWLFFGGAGDHVALVPSRGGGALVAGGSF